MKTINTNKAPEALGPYSHAMVVNNLVFTSGQIPLDTEGNIVSDDVKEQTKQVLDNLSVVLEEGWFGFKLSCESNHFYLRHE